MPRLHLFGVPTLDTGAGQVRLAAPRPNQLLVFLACRGGWVSREVASTLLWPDRSTSKSRANLRFVLVQLRRLGHADGLQARPDALRWQGECDVRSFEAAIDEHRWADAIAVGQGTLRRATARDEQFGQLYPNAIA